MSEFNEKEKHRLRRRSKMARELEKPIYRQRRIEHRRVKDDWKKEFKQEGEIDYGSKQ